MAAGPVRSHCTTLVDITDRKILRSKIGLGDDDNGIRGRAAGFMLVALARRCDSLQRLVEEAGLGSFTSTVSSVGPQPLLAPEFNSGRKENIERLSRASFKLGESQLILPLELQSRFQGFLMLAAIPTVGSDS